LEKANGSISFRHPSKNSRHGHVMLGVGKDATLRQRAPRRFNFFLENGGCLEMMLHDGKTRLFKKC